MSYANIDEHLAAINAACKDAKPGPCVTCGKITPLHLRSSEGPIPYCQKCFTAELEASHKSLLRQAKAAGFKTVEAWQDWQEQQACQEAARAAGFKTVGAWQEWHEQQARQEASLPKGDWE